VVSPLIADWIKNKLRWRYIYSPVFRPTTLSPGQMLRISEHRHPEGVFVLGGAAFDSPMCGVRLEAAPRLDTERNFTLNTIIGTGLTSPNVGYWVAMPPTTPPGVYVLHVFKEWDWLDFFRLYVYNNDTVPHTYLFGGYTLAVLLKPRPKPSREIEEEILESQTEMLNLIGGWRPV